MNTRKKRNELIHEQQRLTQSQNQMLEAFVINFILIIFCYLKQFLLTEFAENLLVKVWYLILGT